MIRYFSLLFFFQLSSPQIALLIIFAHSQVGEYEAAAGISFDMFRHEDLRFAPSKSEDEERWGKDCKSMASTYLGVDQEIKDRAREYSQNGEPIKNWGERCGYWSCCEPTESEEAMAAVMAGERAYNGYPRASPECHLGLKSREEAEAEQERRRIWRKNNWSEEPNGE